MLPARGQEHSLHPNDVIAFCGDSITEQKLYSLYLESYLLMCQPVLPLQTVQCGWNGETATGLLARIKADVLPFKPTVATILYGMNDARQSLSQEERSRTYRRSLTEMINILKSSGVRLKALNCKGDIATITFTAKPPMPPGNWSPCRKIPKAAAFTFR